MSKMGPKEKKLAELRANGGLPKHVEAMIEDGAPLDIIALPGEERPTAAPVKTPRPAPDKPTTQAVLPAPEKKTEPHPKPNGPQAPGKSRKEDVTMRTTAEKTKAKPAAKAKAKPSTERRKAKSDNARKPVAKAPRGNVVEILKLASRPNGVSRAELIALTKWQGAPWKWLFKNSKKTGYCDRWNYSLDVIEGKEGETRYKVAKK